VKNPSSTIRANAPAIGTHLPIRDDAATARTPSQMNARPATCLPAGPSGRKNFSNVVTATIASVPPVRNGFDSQYRTWFTPAASRPNASFVHTQGPPSIGNAVPSSVVRNPYGRKNTTARITIQARPWGPLAATLPMVSRPTRAQSR
jgi:hypothetical protein